MAFFPRALVGPDPNSSFAPLFRLLDDFDDYNRGTSNHHHRGNLKSFNPRFDVKEIANGYELHGELPGVEQKDVEIEFTDPQTITIRGRTERSYTSGTPPAAIEEGKKAGAITDGKASDRGHKAIVEDEDEDTSSKTGELTTTTSAAVPAELKAEQKYWVSERSVGEFARSFSFPTPVDQDAVTASMKNGILSILVPKAKKHEGRKIVIGS